MGVAADDAADKRLFDDAESVIEKVRKADAAITVVGPDDKPVAGCRLHVRLARHEFLFGAAIALGRDETTAEEQAYRRAVASLFNYATTENIMKWKPIEPERGKYNWAAVDKTIEWCTKNGIELKSHCLIWGAEQQGVPDWLLGLPPTEVLARMKERIDTVMGRYRGRIRYYDVVNEPVHCDVFDRIAGAGHIEQVMRWARQADPDAFLIINEYNLIASREDRKRFIALLERLIASGTPLDGIGIQAHEPRTTWHSPTAIVEALNDLATLGKDLHITELTVETHDEDITGGYRAGKWTDEAQAEYYRQLYTLCFGHPKVRAITTWAVFDSRSWLAGGGIYDREGRPKAAATMLDELINRKWRTETDLVADANGSARLRGFKGEYDVEARSPDGKVVQRTGLRPGDGSQWRIRLGAD